MGIVYSIACQYHQHTSRDSDLTHVQLHQSLPRIPGKPQESSVLPNSCPGIAWFLSLSCCLATLQLSECTCKAVTIFPRKKSCSFAEFVAVQCYNYIIHKFVSVGEIGFLYNLLLSCLSGFFSLMCTCARTSHKVAPRLGCSLTRESVAFFKSKRFHCSDVVLAH